MTRIIIIGNGGTGKSTLGDKLSRILDIEVFHLDRMTFMPGWERVPEEVFRKKLDEAIIQENWIIEGWSYHSTLKKRLEEANVIIYLKFPIYVCYTYALERHLKYSYRQNPYDPDNSPILRKTFKMVKAMWKVYKEYEPELQTMLEKVRDKKKLYVFEKRKEVNKFIEDVLSKKMVI